ncbi:EamA family transporter [Diaphorobacter sp. HDW4A]|uniref:EamA family transporter n=1 Tax=Diaphorobacter sp. HDW4A TaxID=2714924 RepID=UPI00140D268E|nr:EamA family transporter [Diaphorobacter sp. HDW4A]QIL80297.1 EamA family transporter [Diaphorobacter sp. HDW4A]
MQRKHILLAIMVTAIWGINFSVIRIGLGTFPPLLLLALRFVLACLPALFLPRPKNISWPRMIAIASTLFIGQFSLLFLSMAHGLSAGLAAVILQAQAFLTMLFASMAFGEKIRVNHIVGSLLACCGLALIVTSAGGAQFTLLGFALCIGAAVSWAMGNVLLRGSGSADMMALMAWLSLIPPLPLLAMSAILEGPERMLHALTHIQPSGIFAVLYLAVLSTTIGYGIWGRLISEYPASKIAPFSLLVPVFGLTASAVLLGERFNAGELAGALAVLAGLCVLISSREQLAKLLQTLGLAGTRKTV